MQHRKSVHWSRYSPKLICLAVLGIAALLISAVPYRVYGATQVSNRYDKLSTPVAGAAAVHEFGFGMLNTATPVGSISIEFCSNSPIIGDTCTVPTGINAAGAVLAFQSGDIGFSIDPSSTISRIVLTRLPSNPIGVSSVYRFTNIGNPNQATTQYVRLQTFSSTDATGIDIENGGIAFALTSGVNVSAEVPPFLRFCVSVTIVSFDCSTATSFFMDLGEFSTSQATRSSSQMVSVTNAPFGYSIFLNGTTLTSGNNTIPALAAQTPSNPGSSQFGINLRANSSPPIGSEPVGPGTANVNPSYSAPNQYRFQAGDAVVSAVTSNDYRKFTVSYVVNINPAQAPGVYATTVSYICLANF